MGTSQWAPGPSEPLPSECPGSDLWGSRTGWHSRCQSTGGGRSAFSQVTWQTAFLKVALWILILLDRCHNLSFSPFIRRRFLHWAGRLPTRQGPLSSVGGEHEVSKEGCALKFRQVEWGDAFSGSGTWVPLAVKSLAWRAGLLHRAFHSSYQSPGDNQPVPSCMHVSPSSPCWVWGFPASPVPPPVPSPFTFHQEHSLLLSDCRLQNVVVSNVLMLFLFLVKGKVGSCTKVVKWQVVSVPTHIACNFSPKQMH